MAAQNVNNGYVYDYINDIVRKERLANSLSIPTFNRVLYACMLEFMEDEYRKWELSQEVTDSLARVMQRKKLTISSGDGTLPLDAGTKYFHTIQCYRQDSLTSEVIYPIDVVTKKEYRVRNSSLLLAPTEEYRICKIIRNNYFVFSPGAGAGDSIYVRYLYIPAQPYFDYYIDADDNIVYLEEGEVHTWVAGDIDSEGNATTPGGMYNSQSVELIFAQEDRFQIMYRMLAKFGVIVHDAQASGLALRQEEKEATP